MTDYCWPDQNAYDPGRNRQAWPVTIATLPVGARIRGQVIARQPFGVFIRIHGVPDARGLAEITAMPRDAALPDIGDGGPPIRITSPGFISPAWLLSTKSESAPRWARNHNL